MIEFIVKDVLRADADVVIQQCNCYATMGKGLAKQVKEAYPEVYKADKEFYMPKGASRLGKFSYALVDFNTKAIVNLYGQLHWRSEEDNRTKYEHFEYGLRKVVTTFKETKLRGKEETVFAVPHRIGSGLADGNWERILGIIETVSNDFNVKFLICKKPT